MKKNNGGFTFLEVLVAVAIVGATVAVLMQSLSWHLDLLAEHKKATEATFLANEMLDILFSDNLDSPAIQKRLEEARKRGFDVRIYLKEGPIEPVKILVIEVHYRRAVYIAKKVVLT